MSKHFTASVGTYFLAFALSSSSFALYDRMQTGTVFTVIGTSGPTVWESFWMFLPECVGEGTAIALVTTLLFALSSGLYWHRTPISKGHAALTAGLIAAVSAYVITFGLIIAGRSVKGPPGFIAETLNSFSGFGLLIFVIVTTNLFSYLGFTVAWQLIKRRSVPQAR